MGCEECTLGSKAYNPCQLGEGKKGAKVMIVADSPTERENMKGMVFCTKSSRNLKDSLEKRGIPLDDVYFTYAIKCPLDDDKDATPKQITLCKDNLWTEIDIVNPEIIVPLGNASLKATLGKTGITKHRGKAVEVDNRIILPMLHPRVVARKPSYKPLILGDLDTLAQVYRTGISEMSDVDYKVIETMEEALSEIDRLEQECLSGDPELEWLSFDLETTGKNPFLPESKIVCISLSNKEHTGITIPLYHRESPIVGDQRGTVVKRLREFLINPNILKVAHNGKFDIKWLEAWLDIEVASFAFDTLLGHYLCISEEQGTQGLKSQAWEFTDMGGYDNDLDEYKSTLPESIRNNYDNIPWRILSKYAAADVDCCLRLLHIYKPMIDKNPKWKVIMNDILIPGSYALKDVETWGMYMSGEVASKFGLEYAEEVQRVIEKLSNYPEVADIEREKLDLFAQRQALMKSVPAKERTEEQKKFISRTNKYKNFKFNWSSVQQLQELFFKKLGLTTSIRTDTGAFGTGEESLKEMAEQHPIANQLLEYRKVNTLNNMFMQKLPKMKDENSIIHPSFNPSGTVTCRLSSEDPNAQQFPRKSEDPTSFQFHHEPKKLFGSRFGDCGCILNADYSQLELRIAAMISDDKHLTDAFKSGADIHIATAAKVWGLALDEVTKAMRTNAKAVNFGVIYGKSGHTFGRDIFMKAPYNYPEKKAMKAGEQLVKDYFKAYPELEKWLKGTIKFAEKYGYVETMFGFRRRLADIHSRDKGIKGNAERQAMNTPIQGTGSYMTLLSIVKIVNWLKTTNKKSKMVCTVHDSIVFDVYIPELPEVAKYVKDAMEHIHEPYIDSEVPILSELELGADYGSSFDVSLEDVLKLDTKEAFQEWYQANLLNKYTSALKQLPEKYGYSPEQVKEYQEIHNLQHINLETCN